MSWEEKMLAAGWLLERDIFGEVVAAIYTGHGGKIVKIEGDVLVQWRDVYQTPPPF